MRILWWSSSVYHTETSMSNSDNPVLIFRKSHASNLAIELSEIERLKALLHSNPYCSPSSLLRLKATTSGSLKKHGDERDNLHAFTTPMVTSRVLEEEIASSAELAKAYMGSEPFKGITSSYGREEALTSSQSSAF
ncbi:hypothetical protein Tco_1452645 [Tanacetum coccineum]